MSLILLIIHLMLAIALIIVVLLQRSEGGALGIGGSSGGGGMSGFLSGRATANLLTRATAVIATLFIMTSLALAMFGGPRQGSITDTIGNPGQQQQQNGAGSQQNGGETTGQ